MTSKRYEIKLPGGEAVTYEVSGSGTITIEQVNGASAGNLPAPEKHRLVAAIKAAPHPGNELPGGAPGHPDQSLPGRDKPVDPDFDKPGGSEGHPSTGNPNLNPNPDVDLNPDLKPGGGRPDNALPGGPPPRPNQGLPGAQPGAGNELPGGPPSTPDNELPETPEPK